MAPDVAGNTNGRKGSLYRSRFQHVQGPKNMKKESERLRTFINWTVSFMDPKKLAKNGFYYTNTEDVVRCAFCHVLIGSWESGDVPEQEHLKHSSDCPLINGLECGNLKLNADGEDENEDSKPEEVEEVVSQDVCGTHGLEIRPFSAPERPGKIPLVLELNNLWTDFEELGVTKISGPVKPHYATLNARLKTFENWPIPEIQSGEKLAEAGFYYTSFQDDVLCFHCGGGLRNWEAEDDPWVEHAKWFSRCGFIILRKGREFVKEILEKERSQQTLKESAKVSEEKGEVKGSCSEKKEAASPTTSTSPSVSSSSGSEKESQLSQSPTLNEKELELCRICYARERGIVFLPCGHFVSCTHCAPSLSACAICRKPFESTVRAYLS